MTDELFDLRRTEHRNPNTVDIDRAGALEIVDLINAEDRTVPEAVASQREEIARAIELAVECFRRGGRLIYVGAGTSGRLGVLDATECPPTFGSDPDRVQGIVAGGYMALIRSQEGAEDDREAAVAALDDRKVGPGDFVLGIAASGTTPFVQSALAHAGERGARTGFLCCTEPAEEIRSGVDVCIVPVVGPEVIAGSTRMKAGTATKLVLNTITTGAMIRLGKVYQNLMVDLQAVSEKLVDRAQRIVMAVTGCSRAEANEVITRAEGSVKTAIIMQNGGVGRAVAELYLEEADGFVRDGIARAEAVRRSQTADSGSYAVHPRAPESERALELTLHAFRSLPRRLGDLVSELSETALAARPAPDKWCIKEHIEHLIVVDDVMNKRLRKILGESEPLLEDWDEEEENAKIIAGDASETAIQLLLMRLADGRARLVARVDAQPVDEFARVGRHERYGPISIYQILQHLIWHDDHHLQTIQALAVGQ